MTAQWHRATPELIRVLADKHAGICDVQGCVGKAQVCVDWHITGHGAVRSWYCHNHTPIPVEAPA